MDERARFVAGLLAGGSMADVCTELEISFQTGYKFLPRCERHGREELSDRCRRLIHYANQRRAQVDRLSLARTREKPC